MPKAHRCVMLLAVVGSLTALALAAETKEDLTRNLWPKERIRAAIEAVEKQKAVGLLSDATYRRTRAMLQARLAGTFDPTMLSATSPPLNFIQNGGFEEVNRNSRPNRSRWLWWGGWSWGGDYENRWEDRPAYVRSGEYSARIRCTGKPGRIGISTPALPVPPDTREVVFTVWAKGEGENQLFLNFEAGARGTLRQRIGTEWEQVTLTGRIDPDADTYHLYIYVTGKGTIWLDDAKLVPAGEAKGGDR
ncbi:MAG: hypothetical protein R6X20_16955 [Phycisphaerae bacterium]